MLYGRKPEGSASPRAPSAPEQATIAVEIVGKDAVDRASTSPLVRDQADVGAGLIKTKEVEMLMGLSSVEL